MKSLYAANICKKCADAKRSLNKKSKGLEMTEEERQKTILELEQEVLSSNLGIKNRN